MNIRKSGLKLNKKKCQVGIKFIAFFGHIVSSQSVKINPAETEAITKTSLPNSVNKLQRLLSMITYLGKFIQNLAEVTFPLRTLLKKEFKLKLEKLQLDAIGKLKLLVSTSPYLKLLIRI